MRVCAVCSVEFDGKSPAKYCPPCALTRRRETRTASGKKKRRKAGIPVIGSIFQCFDCGIDTVLKSGTQKFCETCSKARADEVHRVAHKKWVDAQIGPRKKYRYPENQKRWAEKNPQAVADNVRRYNEANRAVINLKSRQRSRTPERIAWLRAWEANKRANDPRFGIDARMSTAIKHSLKAKKAGRKWEVIVGYTVDQLMSHLELQFLPGMTWENRGKWHIDHRVPKSAFAYTDDADTQFKACWALSNLRPLWAFDNISKGTKSEAEYEAYLKRAA